MLDGQYYNNDIRYIKYCVQQLLFRYVYQCQGVFGFEEKDQQFCYQGVDRKCQECVFEYVNFVVQLVIDSCLDIQYGVIGDGEQNYDNSYNVILFLCNYNQCCNDENQCNDMFIVNFLV